MEPHDQAYRQTLEALRSELRELEGQHTKVTAAISAIEDLLGKRTVSLAGTGASRSAGAAMITVHHASSQSLPESVRMVLVEAERALHIKEIVTRLQDRGVKKNRTPKEVLNSITSALDQKVKSGKIFTKPHPATYGLLEWGSKAGNGKPLTSRDFGQNTRIERV